MIKIKTFPLLGLLLLFSCSREQEDRVKRIEIDFARIDTVVLSSSAIVNLEMTDNSLLYDICALLAKDDRYFIWSRDKAYAFNEKGDFLFNVSRQGQGPGEYLSLSCMYSEDDKICIFDQDQQQILQFDVNGQFVGVRKVSLREGDPSPSKVIPVGNDCYLSVNRFGGDHCKMPVMSFWNKELSTQQIVKGRFLDNGASFSDVFFVEGERILYWEPLKDTLFSVVDGCVIPEYELDFGAYAIPAEEAAKDIYDRIMYVNKPENQSCASVARFYQMDGDYIYFTFMWYDRAYLCRYNEATNQTDVFAVLTDHGQLKMNSFFKISGDDIILVFDSKNDSDRNPSLCILNKKILDE